MPNAIIETLQTLQTSNFDLDVTFDEAISDFSDNIGYAAFDWSNGNSKRR